MKNETREYPRQPSRHGPAQPGYQSALDELMLDRYGIGYVCQHPEILFLGSEVPRGDSLRPFRSCSPGAADGTPGTRTGNGRPLVNGKPQDLPDRINQAYRILNEIYAPYRPPDVNR